MYKFFFLIMIMFYIVSGDTVFAETRIANTSGIEKISKQLSRWREVKQLVKDDAVKQNKHRNAAMVLVLGQFLEYFNESKDKEFLSLLRNGVGTPEQVSLRIKKALEEFDAPNDSYAKKRGSFFSAYISTLDKSGQIYSLYIPESYDPKIQYALEIRPCSNLKFKAPVEEKGSTDYIIAFCQVRGIEGLGELDVIETIRDIQKHYNINPDRIYLSGGSIGGGAVWRMVARYPDIFAAALVDYGWTWGTSRLCLENVNNIPMWIYHDTTDIWVPVSESRAAVKFLSDMGSPIIYNETTGGGHSNQKKDPAWKTHEWLLDQRRNPYPSRVTYTTSTPLRGRAYWLNILEFTNPNALATVNARVTDGLHHKQLFLHLKNIDVLEVELHRKLFPADKPLSVISGGSLLHVSSPLPQRIYIQRNTGDTENIQYTVSLEEPRNETPFRQYTAGGLNSLYVSGEPLMIVRGTGGKDQELVDAIKRFCDSLSRGNRGWSVFPMHECIVGRIPVKTDKEITLEDEKRYNLIIVGSAKVNSLLARIAPELPAVEKDGFLHLGVEKYNLKGAGYGLYHYNPAAPKRFVFVMSSPEIEFYKSMDNGIADLMGEEHPFGLLALRLNPQRIIRRIMWNKYWSVPVEAINGKTLPPPFTTDREVIRDIYNQAMCNASGADFTDYWKPHYYPVWESRARWHDLAAEIGQPETVYLGWASGEDLQKLSKAESIHAGFKLDVYPSLDTVQVDPKKDYKFVTRRSKVFGNLLKHPLHDPVPVRLDLFNEIHRTAERSGKEKTPNKNETKKD